MNDGYSITQINGRWGISRDDGLALNLSDKWVPPELFTHSLHDRSLVEKRLVDYLNPPLGSWGDADKEIRKKAKARGVDSKRLAAMLHVLQMATILNRWDFFSNPTHIEVGEDQALEMVWKNQPGLPVHVFLFSDGTERWIQDGEVSERMPVEKAWIPQIDESGAQLPIEV